MILQNALAIVDRDGVDGLSIRRLSNALGRDPVMLYRHVPNKAAVLDGVAEIVLAQLSVDTADPDWAGQLRTVAHDFRQLALAHPNVVPLLVTRPLATPLGQRPPGMLRPLEDVLALLTSAGFIGDDALHIYRMLFGFLYGHILNELQEVIERPEETDHVLRLGLHRLAITEFPLLRALAPALASYDGAAELDRFLDLLLPSLSAALAPNHDLEVTASWFGTARIRSTSPSSRRRPCRRSGSNDVRPLPSKYDPPPFATQDRVCTDRRSRPRVGHEKQGCIGAAEIAYQLSGEFAMNFGTFGERPGVQPIATGDNHHQFPLPATRSPAISRGSTMIATRNWSASIFVCAAAAAAVAAAPTANADDPNLPVAGSESARQTLNDITALGYNPVLQYENGVPDVPLSQCTVTTVDGADAANGQGNVYVTINCPNSEPAETLVASNHFVSASAAPGIERGKHCEATGYIERRTPADLATVQAIRSVAIFSGNLRVVVRLHVDPEHYVTEPSARGACGDRPLAMHDFG